MNDDLRDAALAAYASLQNGKPEQAKELLIVGLEGGSVNNPLDFERCVKSWKDRTKRR